MDKCWLIETRHQKIVCNFIYKKFKNLQNQQPLIDFWILVTIWGRRGFAERGPEEGFRVASNILYLGLDGIYNLCSHCENQYIISFICVIF